VVKLKGMCMSFSSTSVLKTGPTSESDKITQHLV